MIQVNITKDSELTNRGIFETQDEADAWYLDQCQNFPIGHVRNDVSVPDQQAINEAKAYLAETDWMVIRQMDNAVAVPADVKAKREAARLMINQK
jgi:hypothetical protein